MLYRLSYERIFCNNTILPNNITINADKMQVPGRKFLRCTYEVPRGDFKRPNGLAKGKMEGPRPDKFAFVERSGTIKAPVGLLSDRTVLRKQDGGAPPRQVPLYKTGKNRYNQIKSVCGAPGLTGAPCLPCFLRLRRCAGPSFLCRRFFL